MEPRGTSQDIGVFLRWERVKETRRYFEVNEGAWRPWEGSGASSSGLRLGEAKGAGRCRCLSRAACRAISWGRSCAQVGLGKSPGFGVLKAAAFG